MELRRAARMGHEVVLFQILSRDEIELPLPRAISSSPIWRPAARWRSTPSLDAAGYTDAMAAFLERWHSRAGAEGFQYSLIVTDTPPRARAPSISFSRAAVASVNVLAEPIARCSRSPRSPRRS